MTSQVLNFLWLSLELPPPPDPKNGTIREPLPENYIENVRKAGERHPEAEIDLWVDSRRLTERQMAYLKLSVEEGQPNVHLKDLCGIPAYENEDLYNTAETNLKWRGGGKHSLIWRQVDAAKILVSLQGNFDQTFFADLDFSHMDIRSQEVQDKLEKPGLFIGSGSENQLWGFIREKRKFFKEYYTEALNDAYHGRNAWLTLLLMISGLQRQENMTRDEFCINLASDGTRARQPGSSLHDGYKEKADPSSISRRRLAKVFNEYGDGAYASLSVTRREALRGKLADFVHKHHRKQPAAAAP